MKKLLLCVGLTIFTESLYAQDTSLWVGVSRNSDPLVRRQEAFMDAFCRYISSESIQKATGNGTTYELTADASCEYTAYTCDSCRFRIHSDVVDEEKETVTLSIGSGTFITYRYDSSTTDMNEETRNDITLSIVYQNNTARSAHEYHLLGITRKKASGIESSSEFTYTCKNVEKNE